jgi:hypothetical protein
VLVVIPRLSQDICRAATMTTTTLTEEADLEEEATGTETVPKKRVRSRKQAPSGKRVRKAAPKKSAAKKKTVQKKAVSKKKTAPKQTAPKQPDDDDDDHAMTIAPMPTDDNESTTEVESSNLLVKS